MSIFETKKIKKISYVNIKFRFHSLHFVDHLEFSRRHDLSLDQIE